jgi:hypothetical protein
MFGIKLQTPAGTTFVETIVRSSQGGKVIYDMSQHMNADKTELTLTDSNERTVYVVAMVLETESKQIGCFDSAVTLRPLSVENVVVTPSKILARV